MRNTLHTTSGGEDEAPGAGSGWEGHRGAAGGHSSCAGRMRGLGASLGRARGNTSPVLATLAEAGHACRTGRATQLCLRKEGKERAPSLMNAEAAEGGTPSECGGRLAAV